MLEDYKDHIDPCIKLRLEIEKLETGKLDNIKTVLLMRTNISKNPHEYNSNVIQKRIGIEKGLQEGETANYYLSDNEKGYTFNEHKYEYEYEYSISKYKTQLIRSVTPFLKVLGHNIEKDLNTPSESLARMVSIARETELPEIANSKSKAVIKRRLIVKQEHQRHSKRGTLIKI